MKRLTMLISIFLLGFLTIVSCNQSFKEIEKLPEVEKLSIDHLVSLQQMDIPNQRDVLLNSNFEELDKEFYRNKLSEIDSLKPYSFNGYSELIRIWGGKIKQLEYSFKESKKFESLRQELLEIGKFDPKYSDIGCECYRYAGLKIIITYNSWVYSISISND